MELSGSSLEINPVPRQGFQCVFINCISDSKRLGGRHGTVGEKREAIAMLFYCLVDFRWLVWGNADYLKSELPYLEINVAQLNQLPVAMWSPASAVKEHYRRPFTDRLCQIQRFSISRA